MKISKEELHLYLTRLLSEKIKYFENLIDETRASNNDTKSSMGDKYETGREMLQQEINHLQIQLNVLFQQQEFLKNIRTSALQKVEKGALVKTQKGLFYISVSLGEVVFGGHKIFCISPESPLAKAILGKGENDFFSLNTISQLILNVE